MNQDCPPTLVGHRNMPFRVIPVIDLLNGQVVHAVGGRRAHYQPIQSILHASSEPIPLAHAIRDSLGLQTLYLADLDAIADRPPHFDIWLAIIKSGFHLWIDAGVRDLASAVRLLELDPGSVTIVAGLETLGGPSELTEIVASIGAERVIFSLDLFDGRPKFAEHAAWNTEVPRNLAETAIECGVRELLILDIARVGTSRGSGTTDLLTAIRDDHPPIRLVGGGGLSRIEDVLDLRDAGADAVLIGSAIHDGRIGPRELERLAGGRD